MLSNFLKKKVVYFIDKNVDSQFILTHNKFNNKGICKHYPSVNQEWYNSVYIYNKNNIKLYPSINIIINKIIKTYYDIFFLKKKRKKSSKLSIRFKRLSTNVIFLSKAKIKHTNNKTIITIFTYNRELKNIIYKIKQRKTKFIKLIYKFLIYKLKYKKNFINYINAKNKFFVKNELYSLNNNNNSKNKVFFKNMLYSLKETIKKNKIYKKIININKKKIKSWNKFNRYNIKMLILNKLKFNDNFLLDLKIIISKFFKNNNVELRVIKIKKIHLNSDIFLKSISKKLKDRNNRLLKVLKKALKISKFNKLKKSRILYYKFFISNNKYNNKIFFKKDIIQKYIVCKKKTEKNNSTKYLEKNVFKFLKNKYISGIRFEAGGRLTRRLTASRSIFKIKYKGNIRNVDSSYKKLSSVLLKGYIKSNIQYNLFNSKTRNGSFGLRGWVSSY